MLYFVNSQSEIVGSSTLAVEVEGLTLYPGPAAAIADLYFNGTDIALKPPKPSPAAVWSHDSSAWEIPTTEPPVLTENWGGLLQRLRGSVVFQKIYTASTLNLRANSAYTLLTSTLTNTHNLEDFEWAIAEAREGLATTAIGDFTAEDIEWINDQLVDCSFNLSLS